VEDFLIPGFRYLDEAMKLYWSDLRIPTRDNYRFMRTRIAGGDRTLQIWRDDLKHGRVQLPVMSINRSTHEYNAEKYSPAYHPMMTRFVDSSMTRVRKIYRPVPYLVSYTLSIWAEHKRDVEYALFQIIPRFNPLAELVANDGRMTGTVQLRYGGASDTSDKEASAEQLAKVKYDINVVAEAWLPLPEQVVPTIRAIHGMVEGGSFNQEF
jgi:hypothetical protein